MPHKNWFLSVALASENLGNGVATQRVLIPLEPYGGTSQGSAVMAADILWKEQYLPTIRREADGILYPNSPQLICEDSLVLSSLKQRFYHLLRIIAPRTTLIKVEADDCFAWLASQYEQPNRFYHTLDHLYSCFIEFDFVLHLANDPELLAYALFFHDVATSEEESAAHAVSCFLRLFRTDPSITGTGSHITTLVLATRHIEQQTSFDAKLICDIDLAALGAKPDVFDCLYGLIRKEYSHLSDKQFATGRKQFLKGLLNKEQIFQTEYFRDKYEAQARANIHRCISQLS